MVILYTIVALSALRVRAVKGGHEGGYRMWLWPIPPVVVLLVMAYVVYQTVVADITPLLIALGTRGRRAHLVRGVHPRPQGPLDAP